MTKRPTKLEFDIAIAWLNCNEGEIEEHTSCKNVANWLIDQLDNQTLREVAKEAGVPVGALRKRIKENRKKEQRP